MVDALTVDTVVDGQARVDVEFDRPALRAIISYPGSGETEGRTLYWNLGGELPTYSLGIDVHAASRRIALVEMRLYGGRLQPAPVAQSATATDAGIPLVDVSAWNPDSPFLDINEGFILQGDEQGLRMEFDTQPVERCIIMDDRLTLELDASGRLCAVRLGALSDEVLTFMKQRYG